MSTVPMVTYAKVGRGAKSRQESMSSELLQSKQKKSQDLFSQMNQDNLKYIQKELKLKKNRSDNERTYSSVQDTAINKHPSGQEIPQNQKLFQKYRQEEEVSEKDPHLEDTERQPTSQKPLDILLPEELEEDYYPSQMPKNQQMKRDRQLIESQNTGNFLADEHKSQGENNHKMYHSLPYEDGKKRVVSIQGYFGQAVSTNLNKHEGGLFIEFLEEYISDLNHSKRLKSRQIDKTSIQKKKIDMHREKTSRQHSQRQQKSHVNFQDEQKDQRRKNYQWNRNTFGYQNSKHSFNTHHPSANESSNQDRELRLRFKEQKLQSLMLAEGIQRQRKLLAFKDKTIEDLKTENELLKEQLRHIKMQQNIMNKNQNSYRRDTDYQYQDKFERQKQSAAYDRKQASNNHQYRHSNVIPHKNSHSCKANQKQPQSTDIFQQFAQNHSKGGYRSRKEMDSAEKLSKDFNDFKREDDFVKKMRVRKERQAWI